MSLTRRMFFSLLVARPTLAPAAREPTIAEIETRLRGLQLLEVAKADYLHLARMLEQDNRYQRQLWDVELRWLRTWEIMERRNALQHATPRGD